MGAGWATRLKSETLYRVIAIMLVLIAMVLVVGHDAYAGHPLLTARRRPWRVRSQSASCILLGIPVASC